MNEQTHTDRIRKRDHVIAFTTGAIITCGVTITALLAASLLYKGNQR